MASHEKFSLLRGILRTLGLSPEAVEDITDRIAFFLSGKTEDEEEPGPPVFPYARRDEFLSPAEHSFYHVVRSIVADRALIFPQIPLGSLFRVATKDQSEFYKYNNKIDRKRVDFLLCDPVSLQPLVGLELDDGSHRRSDRQTRDSFVEGVFGAAGMPLIRVPVRHGYPVEQLSTVLSNYIPMTSRAPALTPTAPVQEAQPVASSPSIPFCPQCGTPMVLRTARSGPNQGGKFWGCVNYPRCRGIVQYDPTAD